METAQRRTVVPMHCLNILYTIVVGTWKAPPQFTNPMYLYTVKRNCHIDKWFVAWVAEGVQEWKRVWCICNGNMFLHSWLRMQKEIHSVSMHVMCLRIWNSNNNTLVNMTIQFLLCIGGAFQARVHPCTLGYMKVAGQLWLLVKTVKQLAGT